MIQLLRNIGLVFSLEKTDEVLREYLTFNKQRRRISEETK